MSAPPVRFNDGAAYDRGMGAWSRLAGEIFLDWVAPPAGARWIDVGCGGGAFTDLLFRRCAPSEVQGIDPSEAQLGFARANFPAATFQQGDAQALPFEGDRFDAAAMALVIFFVPDPAKGVAEMARVVRPGGLVAAYAWDMGGGGFPFEPVQAELRAAGLTPPAPPSAEASRIAAMHELWTGAGLDAVETREIVVGRTFDDFDDYWNSSTITGSTRPVIEALTDSERQALKDRVRARLISAGDGRVIHEARANAVKGRVP